MVCRDRNRLAIQSDILGAYSQWAFEICSAFQGTINHLETIRKAKNVFDIDSMQLIHTAKTMRDEGKFLNGSDVDVAPRLLHRCGL